MRKRKPTLKIYIGGDGWFRDMLALPLFDELPKSDICHLLNLEVGVKANYLTALGDAQ